MTIRELPIVFPDFQKKVEERDFDGIKRMIQATFTAPT
jgi:hypothetical protein